MLLQRESGLDRTTSRARRVVQSIGVLAVLVACTGLLGVEARAQEPEGRRMQELRQENAMLRDQLAVLRRELDQLRREVERVQVDIAPEPPRPDAGVPFLKELPRVGRLFDRSGRAEAEEMIEEAPMEDVGDIVETEEAIADPVLQDSEVIDPLVGGRLGAGRSDHYRVREGDTLAKIARRISADSSQGTIARLLEMNPELDAARLRIGQLLNTQGIAREPEPAPRLPPSGRPSPQRDQQRRAGTHSDSELVSLVELATRVVDLDGELELAMARLSDVKSLVDAGREQTITLREAELRVQSSKRKRDLIRSIVDGEIERLQAELTRLRVLAEHGVVSSSELGPLEHRLALLTRIR